MEIRITEPTATTPNISISNTLASVENEDIVSIKLEDDIIYVILGIT